MGGAAGRWVGWQPKNEETVAGRDADGGLPTGPMSPCSAWVRVEQRSDHVEQRLERLAVKKGAQFAALGDTIDTRFATLDAKIDSQSAQTRRFFGLIVAVSASVFIPHP